MHRDLAASLRHIGVAAAGVLDFDAAGFEDRIRRIEDGERCSPSFFARYYDLVGALLKDDLATAEALVAALIAAAPPPAGLQVLDLGGPELGEETARYLRMLNSGEPGEPAMRPPSPEAAAGMRTRLAAGLRLLDTALPDLAGEIRGLVRQIVIVGSAPGAGCQIDGGSHYQLWGALFLNADFHPDSVAVAEALAHESAHCLLFGLCIEEPLVRNPDSQRFASPLRADPRPMDGIFHATFVAARMHWTMSALAGSGHLDAEQAAAARARAGEDAGLFRDGHETIARHAELTPLGREVIDACLGYMDTL
jgi:HEXXH motif-containing protein